nr:DNA cytosine methyltransferase [uncultured Desulfovibrio sp.]
MTFLDLCAGIGGFTMGLEWAGMKCKGQVEKDVFCTRVLEKNWPDVPRWRDVCECAASPDLLPTVDLIAGGYPCQPFSLTGKRKGKRDDRHLWPFIKQIIAAKRPTWCLFENVAGHVTMGLDDVLFDLEALGYSAWGMLIPACAVNSKDRRGRVWILAHTSSNELQGRTPETPTGGDRKTNPYERLAGFLLTGDRASVSLARTYRSGHGVPNGAHRNKALGNAVKPQMAYEFGVAIMAAHYKEHQPCPN